MGAAPPPKPSGHVLRMRRRRASEVMAISSRELPRALACPGELPRALASIDLFDALTLTRKRVLMAQLWQNLGLVAKALGNASEQRLAFAIACERSEPVSERPCGGSVEQRIARAVPRAANAASSKASASSASARATDERRLARMNRENGAGAPCCPARDTVAGRQLQVSRSSDRVTKTGVVGLLLECHCGDVSRLP